MPPVVAMGAIWSAFDNIPMGTKVLFIGLAILIFMANKGGGKSGKGGGGGSTPPSPPPTA